MGTLHLHADGGKHSAPAASHGNAQPLALPAEQTLYRWLRMVEKGEFRDLPSIVAADAAFRSPVEWTTYPGRDLVCLLLSTGVGVFEDFQYRRRLFNSENAALEFIAKIGGVEVQGMHLIRFNSAGELAEIELLMRPAKGVAALGDAMGHKIGPQVKAAVAAAA